MATTRFHLSAPNVSIELPIGRVVGNIQNLTLNITHNQQQIKNLYNTHIQGFVKGFTINNASASRAVIDYESFFGDSNALWEYFKSTKTLEKAAIHYIKDYDIINESTPVTIGGTNSPIIIPMRDVVGAIGNFAISNNNTIDIREAVQLFEKLSIGEISVADFFGFVEFNLVARGDIDLWKLEGCVLQSRNIRIDVGEMIIMENIEILAKRFIDLNLNFKT